MDLRKELERQQRVLGMDHPDTLTTMSNLAAAVFFIEEYHEAVSVGRECLERQQRVLGNDHPGTLTTMNNLASALKNAGEYREAVSVAQECLELRQRVQGKDHPDTLTTMSNLALALYNAGEDREAISVYRECLELRQRVLGNDHPGTLTTMYNLALTLFFVGEYHEAVSVGRECLERQQRVQGNDHPGTLTTMYNLASALDKVGEYSQSCGLWHEYVQLCQDVYGPGHKNFIEAQRRLRESANQWASEIKKEEVNRKREQHDLSNECSVCKNSMDPEFICCSDNCIHVFCRSCVDGWMARCLERNETIHCPACREKWETANTVPECVKRQLGNRMIACKKCEEKISADEWTQHWSTCMERDDDINVTEVLANITAIGEMESVIRVLMDALQREELPLCARALNNYLRQSLPVIHDLNQVVQHQPIGKPGLQIEIQKHKKLMCQLRGTGPNIFLLVGNMIRICKKNPAVRQFPELEELELRLDEKCQRVLDMLRFLLRRNVVNVDS